MKQTIAVWFSCGAASAVAAKKTIEKYGKTHKVLIVNNPVVNEHHDNLRLFNYLFVNQFICCIFV